MLCMCYCSTWTVSVLMKAELNPLNEDNVQNDNCQKIQIIAIYSIEISESPDTKAFTLQLLEAICTQGCDLVDHRHYLQRNSDCSSLLSELFIHFIRAPATNGENLVYMGHVLTQPSVAGKLLVYLLHPLYVDAAGFSMVHHGLRIMDSNDAFCCLLHFLWGIPRIIDVFCWKIPQRGQIAPGGKESKELRQMFKCLEHNVGRLMKHAKDVTVWSEII